MKTHSIMISFSTIALLALHGCATIPGTSDDTMPVAATAIPATDSMLDHYVAWVPRSMAQTATVAEAMTHISLVNAREQTAKQLCRGDWVMNDKVTETVGPFPAYAPVSSGGYPAWYYRISHRPGLRGCQSIDMQKFYHTLQNNLPEWINIKALRTTTLSLLE